MMIVCSSDRIMWAPFKFKEENEENKGGLGSIMNSVNHSFADGRDATPKNIDSIVKKVGEKAGTQSMASAIVLET